MIQLVEHFGKDRISPKNEWVRQQRWFIKARQNRLRREELQDQFQDDITALASSVVLATSAQLQEFEAKLDMYDEATVKALMLNQEQLDIVNSHIQDLLNNAHVMEDGTRVFKTRDGTQVFDEFGNEVSSEVLHPDLIAPSKPIWEDYKEKIDHLDELKIQREEILEFQEKADATRHRISEGNVSEDELDDLKGGLEDMMPEAVKVQMEGYQPTTQKQDLKSQFHSPARPVIEQTVKITVTPSPQL